MQSTLARSPAQRRRARRMLFLGAVMDTSRRSPIDWVLLSASALVASSIALVAPWEVAVASCAILALLFATRSTHPGAVLLVIVAVVVGVLRSRAAVARYQSERDEADAMLGGPARCTARAIVDSSPVQLRDGLRWDARLDDVVCADKGVAWTGRATLYGGPDDLARGDEVALVATLAAPQRLWNASTGDPRPGEAHRGVVRSGGVLDARRTARSSGLLARIDRARARVRSRIASTFKADVAPMARALVLGESDLAPDDDRAFRTSGLSHLLAVSGMHLVLVLALVVSVTEGALARVERIAARVDVGRLAAVVGVPVAWIYAELAGAGGSTLRAAWMATAGLTARALGRRTDATRSFGLSLGAMAILDPLVAFDLSFALSVGATAGLLAFSTQLGERVASHSPRRGKVIARAVATTVAASIPCLPMIARFSPTVPLGGVIANVIAVPLGECAALPLCLVHAIIAWWPAAEAGCALVASGALVLVRLVARGFSVPALAADVPQPSSWQLAVLAVMLAASALRVRALFVIHLVGAAALLVLEVALRRGGAPHGILRVTFLDVGQGDAALVDLPDGDALLIDGGGLVGSPSDIGARVIAPELRARRRRALAAVVLTHPHPDHFGGLATGLDGIRVGALWDTGQGEQEQVGGAYSSLLEGSRARGVPILRPDRLCGTHTVGGVTIDVLAPCPGFSSDSGPNDNSFVLRIAYGGRAFLMMGDAEHEEEASLLATSRDELRADVLKVGHHGSRTSSAPAFVAAVAPREGIVSVGCRNRFGHPHATTLATLQREGVRVWRTDRDGAVAVTTDGETLTVEAMAPAR